MNSQSFFRKCLSVQAVTKFRSNQNKFSFYTNFHFCIVHYKSIWSFVILNIYLHENKKKPQNTKKKRIICKYDFCSPKRCIFNIPNCICMLGPGRVIGAARAHTNSAFDFLSWPTIRRGKVHWRCMQYNTRKTPSARVIVASLVTQTSLAHLASIFCIRNRLIRNLICHRD